MAKPRIFISSTYYDLKHIRNALEDFIENMGYESVLFESGDIPFHHDIALADSCYGEVEKCHMLVLIIGGRYGSNADPATESTETTNIEQTYEIFNSVTRQEYQRARNRNIPIFIFVEKGVRSEYETYKNNRKNESISYAHVDSVNIFRLLDDILKQPSNNYVREFDKFADISHWLRDQWAGLFADALSKRHSESTLKDLSSQIAQLSEVTASMKHYTESIMKKLEPDQFQEIFKQQEKAQRQKRYLRFRQEPLIRYLRDAERIPASRLFNVFQNASTVEEMLQEAGFSQNFISDFLLNNGKAATADFKQLKNLYGADPIDDDLPQEIPSSEE